MFYVVFLLFFALFVSWETLFHCTVYSVYGWNDNKLLLILNLVLWLIYFFLIWELIITYYFPWVRISNWCSLSSWAGSGAMPWFKSTLIVIFGYNNSLQLVLVHLCWFKIWIKTENLDFALKWYFTVTSIYKIILLNLYRNQKLSEIFRISISQEVNVCLVQGTLGKYKLIRVF